MLIGLYGDSRSGKDTVAKILQEEHGFEWRSFAAPLREILLGVNPPVGNNVDGYDFTLKEAVENYGWDWVKKQYPYSVDMMIGLGQSVRDIIGIDTWLTPVLGAPGTKVELPERLVISDVRQPNEYERIHDLGGKVWKIIRPSNTTRRGMDGLLDDRLFSARLWNNSDIDDLKRIVSREVKALENPRP